MNTQDYFKDIYKDFFDSESQPRIEVKKEDNEEEISSLLLKIDNLNITDESKELLKKIVDYMDKYNSGIEKNYVPFRVVLKTNNNTLMEEVSSILSFAGVYYNYFINNKELKLSLHKVNKETSLNDYGFILMYGLNGINLIDNVYSKDFIYDLKE